MAGVFVRRALVALAAACACAVGAAPAVAAPPANDTWQGAYPLGLPGSLVGNRNVPSYSDGTGAPRYTQDIDTTDATSSADDPPLVTAREESTCSTAVVISGYRTVWYTIRLAERTALTIDTLRSDYPTALALYEGSVSPDTLVTCARGNLVDSQTALNFVTRPGRTYYLELAGTTPVAGPAKASIYIRATDVQPPLLTITANQAEAQPGRRAVFGMAATPDEGSGPDPNAMPAWEVTFLPDGTSEEIPLEVTPVVDANGTEVRVRWPRGQTGWGKAVVTLPDLAGNMGKNTLRLRIKDRTAPSVRKPGFRLDHRRNRVWAWITCSEAGFARMALLGTSRGETTIRVRAGVRKRVRWVRRKPSGYLLTYRCKDAAGNWSATRFSRPFLLR